MNPRAVLAPGRLRRRFPAALVGAQTVLTASWLLSLDSACVDPNRYGGCEGPLSPREPVVFGIALGAGLVVLLVALVVPATWGEWLTDTSPTLAALAAVDRWTTALATLLLAGAALAIPQLFLGELGVRGATWVALALPAWPALLALFGALTLAVYVPPTLLDLPAVVLLTMGILLVIAVGAMQVLWYYAIALAVRSALARLGALVGGGRPTRSESE